jgi:hypothetical protein
MKLAHRRAIVRTLPLLAAAAMLWSASAQAVAPVQYRVLHAFCENISTCADGFQPGGEQLVRDAGSDLFGTASGGGRYQAGTLYDLTPKHGGARYFRHVLSAFCFPGKCGSGSHPNSGVIMDSAGNLYGTTPANSDSACGVAYEAVISGDKAQMKALHNFVGSKGDGCGPTFAALTYQGKDTGQLYDGTSPLYGLTGQGGANGHGALFELIPPKPGRKAWQENILASFCGLPSCADSDAPQGNLVMDAAGDFFTTTSNGRILEIVPDSGAFIVTLAYRSNTSENYGWLQIEADGTLIGVAGSGGATSNGTLFKLVFDPINGYQYTLLHDFCAASNCTDGGMPGAVTLDSSGNIFGIAQGGANPAPNGSPLGAGVIFEYSSGGNYSVLHNFCAQADCTDGGVPSSGLTTDGNGNFFGTTAFGGVPFSTGAGSVYELSLF